MPKSSFTWFRNAPAWLGWDSPCKIRNCLIKSTISFPLSKKVLFLFRLQPALSGRVFAYLISIRTWWRLPRISSSNDEPTESTISFPLRHRAPMSRQKYYFLSVSSIGPSSCLASTKEMFHFFIATILYRAEALFPFRKSTIFFPHGDSPELDLEIIHS